MRLIFSLLVACGLASAADCDASFQLNAQGATVQFNNQTKACYNWQVSYFVSGFSAVSVQFESAPNGSTGNVPGTWVAFAGGLTQGSVNPSSVATEATNAFTGSFPWVRIHLVSATGSGTITGRMLGAQLTSANNFPSVFNPVSSPFGSFYPPVDSDFSWVDQGPATLDVVSDGIYINIPDGGSGSTTLSKRCATLPTAPWTVTAAFIYPITNISLWSGLVVQQTGGTKVTEGLRVLGQGNSPFISTSYNCTGTTTATCTNDTSTTVGWGGAGHNFFWERIWDNGVNIRQYQTSLDGVTWTVIGRYSTGFDVPAYGTIVPTQACFSMNDPTSNTFKIDYKVVSWKICSGAQTSQC